MNFSIAARFGTISIAAVFVLAGCSGTLTPRLTQGAASPAAQRAAGSDLLYVSGGCGGTCIQSYPKGKPAGSLASGGGGICSDKGGNVFVPTATGSGSAVIYEYAHGGTTPIATLTLSGLLAEGCAVDPHSGDLAVTYLCKDCPYGPLAVFKNAKGSPETYEQAGVFLSFCGYDAKGNLFADGTNLSGGVNLLELGHGSTILKPISLDQSLSNAGQVQWDGKYVAIEDLSHPVIYQFTVTGSAATRAGTTQLKGAGSWGGQSWIEGHTVIVPFTASGSDPSEIGYWKYPAGGTATKIFKKHMSPGVLAGATVSIAP